MFGGDNGFRTGFQSRPSGFFLMQGCGSSFSVFGWDDGYRTSFQSRPSGFFHAGLREQFVHAGLRTSLGFGVAGAVWR